MDMEFNLPVGVRDALLKGSAEEMALLPQSGVNQTWHYDQVRFYSTYICKPTRLHVHTRIHTHAYTHIYIHTHAHKRSTVQGFRSTENKRQ